jgi:outer membrane protein assembly factor BamB
MARKLLLFVCFVAAAMVSTSAQGPRRIPIGDWPELRGPNRDGISKETGLIDRWALNGENFLWRAPYGSRSTPAVVGNRVYVQNPAGRGTALQERVMALDADTGKVVWEYKFNIFQSDIPAHRVGWASPSVDLETGNIYAFSGGAEAIALNKDGKLLWSRSFGEEWAAFTTHGGRTMSPVIDGNLVIVSAPVSSWGTSAARTHRYMALDKRTGDIIYISNPGGRPYDTAYSSPLIANINGMRLLIAGLGDGAIHAVKVQTGERVWSFPVSKRSINTGVAVRGDTVYISHGDENLEGNELGLLAAIDGTQKGDIKTTKWQQKGIEFAFSSPIIDGTRLYQLDGGSKLHVFDTETGQESWSLQLGTLQKASPVLADGKIYVGTDNGKFFIVRLKPNGGEILSSVELPNSVQSCCGSEGTPEQILSGAAISRGRIFFASSDAIYAIGSKQATKPTGFAVDEPAVVGSGEPAFVQVAPTEFALEGGQKLQLHARLFDDKGRFLKEDTTATWSLDGLKGTVANGLFTPEPGEAAGTIKATVGALSGTARARVSRSLPWKEDFEGYQDGAVPVGWINAVGGKLAVATIEGNKVLAKPPDDTIFKRFRAFMGPTTWSDYTYEADVRSGTRRRQMGDVGIIAQRYALTLYGTTQKLKIEPWEEEIQRTVTLPYTWAADKWYHLKLRVENLPNGQVRARGKAYPKGDPEPAEWMIEKVDPIGNRQGAPGIFMDAQFGAALDNLSLSKNQ